MGWHILTRLFSIYIPYEDVAIIKPFCSNYFGVIPIRWTSLWSRAAHEPLPVLIAVVIAIRALEKRLEVIPVRHDMIHNVRSHDVVLLHVSVHEECYRSK